MVASDEWLNLVLTHSSNPHHYVNSVILQCVVEKVGYCCLPLWMSLSPIARLGLRAPVRRPRASKAPLCTHQDWVIGLSQTWASNTGPVIQALGVHTEPSANLFLNFASPVTCTQGHSSQNSSAPWMISKLNSRDTNRKEHSIYW